MRFMRLIIVAVLVALVGWWGISKFSTDSAVKNIVPSVKVSVAKAARKDVPVTLSLVGNVIAFETVAIRSRIDSQIMEVKFHDGDAVKKGQVLFILDDRALKAQLAQEQAKLVNAKLQYERAKKLVVEKFVAQSQVDDSKATYEAQQASLENARTLLNYTIITAPINGRVGTINVTQGNNVKANDTAPLVTINQVTPIRAEFHIPERYYEQVRAASSIPVIAARKGAAEVTTGKLEYIDNEIDTQTGSFVARAVFENEKETLWPGMFANLTLDLGREDAALTIPAVAVQGDEGKHFIFTVQESKAVKTPVEVQISGDDAVVRKGIAEGDTVITDGLLRVTDGATVEIADSAAK